MDLNDTFDARYPLTHWVPTASERRRTRTKSTCLGKLCNSLKMCGLSKDARPWLSYVSLITVALLSNPTKMLKINEIYAFIEQTFPYYRYSRVNWRNSVRHNLSLNDCFVKVTVGAEKGKRRGHYWTLHPDSFTMFDQGSLMRRHRRFMKPSKESNDTSKANAENALVMPILQKISEELTRWRQQILSLQPEVCKASVVDYRQNLFDSNLQVGYFQGNQVAEQAPFAYYQRGMQSSQIEAFNPPFACDSNFCISSSDAENCGHYVTQGELSQMQTGSTMPYTAFFPMITNSPSCIQCLAVSNQTTPQMDSIYVSNGCGPTTETSQYNAQHLYDPLTGDFVPAAI